MLPNFFKIAFRNLRKRKGFSALNIFGLGLAFAVSLLLFATALRELSFDHFHENVEDLYALYWQENRREGIQKSTGMPMILVPTLRAEFPDLVGAVRVYDDGGSVEYAGKTFKFGINLVDASFFGMFSFPIAEGDRANPLPHLNAAVLSQEIARQIFGEENPLGKTLRWKSDGKETELVVTAIAETPPYETNLGFNFLARVENAPAAKDPSWGNHNHNDYVLLRPGVDPLAFEQRLRPFVRKHLAPHAELLKQNGAVPDEQGDVVTLRLYPLRHLHFAKEIHGGAMEKMLPFGLLVIGFFVLAIASINFVNLTIGTSVTRSLEVGVRKVLGADRREVALQFWGEAMLVVALASALGLMLVQWALPQYNALFEHEIGIGSPFILGSLGVILLLTGVLAGGYPAWVLSRFQPATVLKGSAKLGSPSVVRNLLVTLQFAISIILIASTMVVMQQFEYVRNKPLGFNQNQVFSIPIGDDLEGRRALALMRNELQNQPNILSVTGSMRNLGLGKDGSTITSIMGFDQDGEMLKSHWLTVDYDFVETLDLTLLAGKTFDRNRLPDTAQVPAIVNETLAKQIAKSENPQDAVGKFLNTDPRGEVIGVVKDFHFQRLDRAIEPASLVLDTRFGIHYVFVKVAPTALPETVARLETAWKKVSPGTEFRGTFLDENTQRQYKTEQVLSYIFATAGGLTILLSCLGLFAIAVLTIVQRTKEIGIRKVLGASVAGIVGLLAKDFLKWVGYAAVLALPLAWLAMRAWLDNYHYRIALHWWVFLAAVAAAVAIAFLTVSLQSVRAARRNPVEALRSE